MDLLLDAHAIIAESPTWVGEEQAIYWIDVRAPALHRLDLTTHATRTWPLPSDIGAFALSADRRTAVVALRTGLFDLDLEHGTLTLLAASPFDPSLHRFNEGACDSRGRFWIGTMYDPVARTSGPPERGGLYTFTRDEGLVRQPDAAELCNGMAWSPDETTFYVAHSPHRTVLAFPFDATAGRLGASRTLVVTPQSLGVPDGAAVDEEGCYWCALHGGGRLHRYRPNGERVSEVELPVSEPTMCAFVGPDLDVMVVTSASDQLSDEQRRRQPHAGGLFRFKPGVRGIVRHFTVR